MAHYPEIRVSVRSRNPLALVAAVREELRRARVERAEIQRFSDQALTSKDRKNVRRVCQEWVTVDAP
jgi:hypothetical protein